MRYRVHAYKPRAIQCQQCHKFGHTASLCTRGQRCSRCGGKHSENECDSNPHCVNCKKAHGADNPRCSARRRENEIARYRAEHVNSTRQEAKEATQRSYATAVREGKSASNKSQLESRNSHHPNTEEEDAKQASGTHSKRTPGHAAPDRTPPGRDSTHQVKKPKQNQCTRDFYEAIRLARMALEANSDILQEHPIVKALCATLFDLLPQIVESALTSVQNHGRNQHGLTF